MTMTRDGTPSRVCTLTVTTPLADLRDGELRRLWEQFAQQVADLAHHPAFNDLGIRVGGVPQ